MSLPTRPPQSSSANSPEDLRLTRRIEAEFREMPGMTLTLWQAARLFNVEVLQCEQVLGALVARGRLTTNGRIFASAHGGRRSA